MADNEQDMSRAKTLLYEATTHHWAHAEQIRWTLLSNFLVAASILLLSWAALFVPANGNSQLVLISLCIGGIVLSLTWLGLGKRANAFVNIYNELGKVLEIPCGASITGPFMKADEYRNDTKSKAIRCLRTGNIVVGVPVLFLALFVTLAVVTLSVSSQAVKGDIIEGFDFSGPFGVYTGVYLPPSEVDSPNSSERFQTGE